MKRRNAMLAAVAIAASLAIPACSSSGNASDATKSAAASLATNPTVVKAKAELKTNFDKDFTAAHPIASLTKVLQETFPGASSSDIVTEGLKTFKLKDRHAGPEQDAWFEGIVLFAMNQGATGVGSGQPSIPAVTIPASKSPSTTPTP